MPDEDIVSKGTSFEHLCHVTFFVLWKKMKGTTFPHYGDQELFVDCNNNNVNIHPWPLKKWTCWMNCFSLCKSVAFFFLEFILLLHAEFFSFVFAKSHRCKLRSDMDAPFFCIIFYIQLHHFFDASFFTMTSWLLHK